MCNKRGQTSRKKKSIWLTKDLIKMTALTIVIILGIVLMIFILRKNNKADNIPVTKKSEPSFNFKISREIKGIDPLPFHINNFDKAIADKDFDLANLPFAIAIELVRQKNLDGNMNWKCKVSADTQTRRKLCALTDPLTAPTCIFLRVGAQMHNLT